MRRAGGMVLLAVAMSIGFAAAVSAEPGPRRSAATAIPGIEGREARLHARIVHGVRSGRLTRLEARRLSLGLRHIDVMERRARADGVVTPRERLLLGRALDRESRAINRLEHNLRIRRA